MELTLNLIWVCVAIAAVLVLLASLSSNGARLRQPASYALKVIAMGCALVILFFVISMTDDLHDQAVLFEEKKPSRVLFEMSNPAPSSSAQAIPLVFFLFCVSLTVVLPGARKLIDSSRQVLTVASVLRDPIDLRAPPPSIT